MSKWLPYGSRKASAKIRKNWQFAVSPWQFSDQHTFRLRANCPLQTVSYQVFPTFTPQF
jgi:hypothetical protein